MFFISCPFFVPSSTEIIHIHIHFSYHKTGNNHAFYPVIYRTLATSPVTMKGCCVKDAIFIFSFIQYSSKRGDEEHRGRRRCYSYHLSSRPACRLWQKRSWKSHSIQISSKEPTKRSKGTRSWGPWLGYFLFQFTFLKNRMDLKENSEWTSKIFLLKVAKCQGLFCWQPLLLTAFLNWTGWCLLMHREFLHHPLLMDQTVNSWQLARKIVPFLCCIINWRSLLLFSAADTFFHMLNCLR